MAAGGGASTESGVPPAQKRRRRVVMRPAGDAVMVVGLAVGLYALLPRLGGLSRDAAELRHARLAFVAAAVVAQAVSLACYALLYRRVLASLEARVPFWLTARVTLASFLVSHVTPFGSAAGTVPVQHRSRQGGPDQQLAAASSRAGGLPSPPAEPERS